MAEENNRDFFNQLLERILANVCLWENFDDETKRDIYILDGQMLHEDGKLKFKVHYFLGRKSGYKTVEEMSQDYVATPGDLARLGEEIGAAPFRLISRGTPG